MELKGTLALVTGGARRVGRAIALELGAAGADIAIHYGRSQAEAESTIADLADHGVEARPVQADLSNLESAASLPDRVADAFGRPANVLVNSASGFPTDSLADATAESWRSAQTLSLGAPVFLTQAFARLLGDDPGAVVNITDVRTATPYKTHFSYIVAKGGLDAFTKAAAVALAPSIRVNAVALGVILPPPGEDEAFAAKLASRLPLQRVGGTDPVARAVRFLVEDDFVTGEIVRIDGGGHLIPA
ncbi:MAG: SDR family oxidoreductase [Acidimicrobiia bacterium]|nr:SDR family oxidoreductase [Acidimicrobiia bacterium]